ncbi:MAG TPA: SDR family oxidoreductase [Nocardioidaceae bacterium]|nr:SDR family oxidoreductase [Nocardioidaceae bacterium]
MTDSLTKAVAITGGARGIGRATAEAFLARGTSVVLGDIDEALVEQAARELVVSTGGTVIGLVLDVTDPGSFETFLETAEIAIGPLDVLVNNAGIMPTGRFLDEPLEVADRQIGINVRGVVIGSKLAGRRFAARGQGHIVNIASVAGLVAGPGVATYSATKFAIVGLGSALSQELVADGVTVTTICPTFVNTELIAGLNPNWITRKVGFVEPHDIANAVVDSVAKGKSGQRVVPRRGGAAVALMAPLPEKIRNRLGELLGTHEVTLNTDREKRDAYLQRAEGTDS